MGRTRNRILGSLRLTRLRARLALDDLRDSLRADGRTPAPVPVRVQEPTRRD